MIRILPALKQLLESETGPVGEDIRRRTERVLEAAQAEVPVLTGALHDSLKSEIVRDASGIYGLVTAGEDYASFVELGTQKDPAQPYLRPALRRAR